MTNGTLVVDPYDNQHVVFLDVVRHDTVDLAMTVGLWTMLGALTSGVKRQVWLPYLEHKFKTNFHLRHHERLRTMRDLWNDPVLVGGLEEHFRRRYKGDPQHVTMAMDRFRTMVKLHESTNKTNPAQRQEPPGPDDTDENRSRGEEKQIAATTILLWTILGCMVLVCAQNVLFLPCSYYPVGETQACDVEFGDLLTDTV